MSTKKVYIWNIQDDVYETPFNQCIIAEAFTYLKYADYTIYELDASYTETVDDVIKSLFNCRCYNVRQWINSSCDIKTIPVIRLIHEPLSAEFILESEAAAWRHAHIIMVQNVSRRISNLLADTIVKFIKLGLKYCETAKE